MFDMLDRTPGKTVEVVLTAAEMLVALYVSGMRRVSNLKRGVKPKYGAPEKFGAWEIDIMACQAEMAVAKHFNLYWAGTVNEWGSRDVGGLIEVRSCRESQHKLIVHPDDTDDAPFVLVYPDPPVMTLLGWMRGRDAKADRYWSDPAGGRPAFFVKQDDLHGMNELTVEALRDVQTAA
jgi:hypothetical protein